jgi:yeast amino acid transporter
VGWNYFYTSLLTVPVEVTAGTLILSFWDTNTGRQVLYTTILIACTVFINVFGEPTSVKSYPRQFSLFTAVRIFAETEFVLAVTKILLIIGLILLGLIIDLGGGPDHDRKSSAVRCEIAFIRFPRPRVPLLA